MKRVYTCNFGSTKSGLGTVGYVLRDDDGNVVQARTTSGIFEFPTTGIYGADVTLSDTFSGSIEWDTGGASPIYAVEDISFGQYTAPVKTGVADEVRTLLRAHLNQLVDFLNEKFKGIVIPTVDFSPIAKELVKLKTEIVDNINKEEVDEPEEEIDFTPVLDAVEKVRKEISTRELEIKSLVEDLEIPNHVDKLEQLAHQMTEVQKDVAVISVDAEKLISELKKDVQAVIDGVRNEVLGVPEKISIPNYEERLNKIEKKMGEGINFLVKSGKQDLEDAKKDMGEAIAQLRELVSEFGVNLSTEAKALNNHFSSKLSDSVRNLLEMMNELHPDTLEKRRLSKEQESNKLKFIMGVKNNG